MEVAIDRPVRELFTYGVDAELVEGWILDPDALDACCAGAGAVVLAADRAADVRDACRRHPETSVVAVADPLAALGRLAAYGRILLLGLLSLGWFTGFNPLGWILGPARNALVGLIMGS